MDPARIGVSLAAAGAAYAASQFPLTPLSGAAVGGVVGGVLKRVYDEYASQEDTQHDDFYYTVPPSKRLRGSNTDTMDTTVKSLTNQRMAYSRSGRVSVKRFKKKKVTWKRRHVQRTPRARGGISSTAVTGYQPSNYRKQATAILASASYAFDITGSTTCLNAMSLGTTQVGDRIGKDIYMKELCIQGVFQNKAASTTNVCRMIVLIDYESRGGTTSITEVLNTNYAIAPYNSANLHRFKVLYDQTVVLVGAAGTDNCMKAVSVRIPLNTTTYYNNGNAGTYADIERGSLWMITIGTAAVGTTSAEAVVSTTLQYISQ